MRLAELLGRSVVLATPGEVPAIADGGVVLLENIRFDTRETSKDDAERGAFADELVALTGENGAFVSDGFGVVHRKQASVYDVATRLPSYTGALVAAEADVLARLSEDPVRPYAVVLGGSKVSDKIAVIEALLPKVDALVVGGGMCFTFLAAQGHSVGASLLQEEQIDNAKALLESGKIVLPVDVVVADSFSADAQTRVVPVDAIPDGWLGLDVGPESVAVFTKALDGAKTIFWNGPMGVFEMAAFAEGTRGVAQAIVDATSAGAFSVVGGGDSAAAVRVLGLPDDGFSHISTGGGASLEYLEGKTLPGLAVLAD
ncbi:phosphoglycerate kinase [Pseudonocardia sp. N23]|nr:phosphoglycerate kinase [Pseudonocardia sp. N23]